MELKFDPLLNDLCKLYLYVAKQELVPEPKLPSGNQICQ